MSSRIAIAALALAVWCAPARTLAADRLCDASFQNCRTPLLNLIAAERIGIDVAFWMMEDTRYWKIVSKTMANMSRAGTVWSFRTN